MTRIIIACLLLGITIFSNAQDYSKMSSQLKEIVLNNIKTTKAQIIEDNSKSILLFVKGDDADLSKYSIRQQGDLHIAKIPVSDIAKLSLSPRIERMEYTRTCYKECLDSAILNINVDKVWAGINLPQAYDGTGVLVGNVDMGHDYTHPTFRSTKDGRLRIVRVWDVGDTIQNWTYNENSAFPMGVLYTDTTEIIKKGGSSDCNTNCHGTHTAGIASGSGWGSNFRGIAPESDIYLTMFPTRGSNDSYYLLPDSTDIYYTGAFTALAYQNIFDYADSINQPCVINFSMGDAESMTGDNNLFEEYCKRMTGPGKIIVAAAGNEGDHCCYLPKGANDTIVGGIINTSVNHFFLNIKTKDKLSLRITNFSQRNDSNQTRTIELDCEIKDGKITNESGLKIGNYNLFQDKDILDSMAIYVYPDYCSYDDNSIGYDITFYDGQKEISKNIYVLEIIGENAKAEIFLSLAFAELLPLNFENYHLNGSQKGGTIDLPGSLSSVITVGATVHRNRFINIYGDTLSFFSEDSTVGRAEFSSMGPTLHGSIKPDITAPGVNISSAYNSYCTSDTNYYNNQVTSEVEFNGKTYKYMSCSGTSMSSPIVAGTIALWLQADPTLTRERIIEIFKKTSRHYDETISYPNNEYGYGEIDAYKGLLEILGLTKIEGLSNNLLQNINVFSPNRGTINIVFEEASNIPVTCKLYAPSGMLLKTVTIPAHTTSYTINADNITGVIAVQVSDMGSTLVRVHN